MYILRVMYRRYMSNVKEMIYTLQEYIIQNKIN